MQSEVISMQQTVAWLPEMSILEEATKVERKVFSIVSRENLIWGVCTKMRTEPRMWLWNGPCINKRCINVTLNRRTSCLFIWPHLQESARCPPAGPWGDGVYSSITSLHTKSEISDFFYLLTTAFCSSVWAFLLPFVTNIRTINV